MASESTNRIGQQASKLIHPELSYLITGILFEVHNQLGRFLREKTYCDLIELKLKDKKLHYARELLSKETGGKVDFLIENKIILETKAKQLINKEDYYQIQRYLQEFNIQLGLLVNFRNKYLKPLRILKVSKISKLG